MRRRSDPEGTDERRGWALQSRGENDIQQERSRPVEGCSIERGHTQRHDGAWRSRDERREGRGEVTGLLMGRAVVVDGLQVGQPSWPARWQHLRRLVAEPSQPMQVSGAPIVFVSSRTRRPAIALGTVSFCARSTAALKPTKAASDEGC